MKSKTKTINTTLISRSTLYLNSLNNEIPVIAPMATHGIGIENISVESIENNIRKININTDRFLSTNLSSVFNN